MPKRLFDIISSFIVLLLLLPIFLLVILSILIDSRGGIFYVQERVGKNGGLFRLLKFRTMFVGADKLGLLTVGGRDQRITRIGFFLRRYKLDELPQLINVLKGDMSVVGPRPEVPKYVALYTPEQREVLSLKPGLTDPASMAYMNENAMLETSSDPEKMYIEQILPQKLAMSIAYAQNQSLKNDIKIIFKTLGSIL